MKKIFILIGLITAFAFTTSTESVEKVGWQSWNNGFPSAAASGKIALIDTYTDWCGWCKRMDATTYSDSTVLAKINSNFVPIKFNPELDGSYIVGDTSISGRALLGALNKGKSSGYPTTFFYVPAKNIMYQYPGYMDAASFSKVLDEMVASNQLVTLPGISEPTK
jgi:uncharacterized protein YyaL (SSP411 family)